MQKAQVEYQILRNVQELVESNYINGIPRHHLPSARTLKKEEGASIFFIADAADFVKLDTEVIQEIFRDRHIIVRNNAQRDFEWSLETLSLVGGLYQSRDIQGLWFMHPPIIHTHT